MSATATDALTEARQAIEEGQHGRARRLLRDVLQHDPNNYRAWLWLAGITESAVASLEYVRRAHQIKPDDPIVQRALQWAEERSAAPPPRPTEETTRPAAPAETPGHAPLTPMDSAAPTSSPPAPPTTEEEAATPAAPADMAAPSWGRRLLILLVIAVLLWLLVLALNRARLQSQQPATLVLQAQSGMARLAGAGLAAPIPAVAAADDNAPAPDAYAPAGSQPVLSLTPEPGATADPGVVSQSESPPGADTTIRRVKLAARSEEPRPTWTPTPTATPLPSPTPLPTATPEPAPAFAAQEARWIDVNLATQTLTAYEYDRPVYTALVSSGTWLHPTVEGQFRIYLRYESQNMSGYHLGFDYYLPNVPYVMYFFENYALHGAYWHNNFGTPMSHGCVNLDLGTAEWLYTFATEGTLVNVHY